MKHLVITLLACVFFTVLPGCERFVQGIEPPIDSIDDAALDSEEHIPFLIRGVRGSFAKTIGRLSLQAGALSDEMVFDRNVPGATSFAFEQIDAGSILLDNEESDYTMELLGRLRFYADDLFARTNRIAFSDPTLKNSALYTACLYGGIARHLWAVYFGLSQENGGGVIDAGPFIPSARMEELALEKLNAALQYASTDQERRTVQTLIARIHLYEGRYADAETAALAGLQDGDAPLQAEYGSESRNEWHSQAGRGRVQFAVAARFGTYLAEDASEAARIPCSVQQGSDGSSTYLRQEKYPAADAPIDYLCWQENALIVAETAARSGRLTLALEKINAVRASHGLGPRGETALDSVIVERDKELFGTGARLADQRRLGRWHLPAGSWRYLPISARERSGNKNLE